MKTCPLDFVVDVDAVGSEGSLAPNLLLSEGRCIPPSGRARNMRFRRSLGKESGSSIRCSRRHSLTGSSRRLIDGGTRLEDP